MKEEKKLTMEEITAKYDKEIEKLQSSNDGVSTTQEEGHDKAPPEKPEGDTYDFKEGYTEENEKNTKTPESRLTFTEEEIQISEEEIIDY